MEITGIIHRIEEVENIGYNFQNLFFYLKYVDTNGKMQFLKFKLSNGRVDLIEGFKIGDKVKITFQLEGNETTNDKKKPVIYDRKEVYSIQGIGETPINKVEEEDESRFYRLEEGEEDDELDFC